MRKETIDKLIESEIKKGTFHSIRWNKELKTKKSCADTITKRTYVSSARLGVDYSHMKSVKETHNLDEKGNAIVESLPWGTWDRFPYTISHKGNEYLRVSMIDGTKFDTTYYRNGKQVTKESIMSDCLKSGFSGKPSTIFTLNISNIDEII